MEEVRARVEDYKEETEGLGQMGSEPEEIA